MQTEDKRESSGAGRETCQGASRDADTQEKTADQSRQIPKSSKDAWRDGAERDGNAQEDAKRHFLKNIRQIGGNATLVRRLSNGRMEPVFASERFAAMMECSVQEAMALYAGKGFYKTTDPEDRPLVRSILKNRVSFDGSQTLTIQKITAKKNRIWCNVHYAFIDDYGENYVYCLYSDVTALKEYEEKFRTTYTALGNSFYQVNERTLSMARINLTKDRMEEIRGRDLFASDSFDYSFSRAIRLRAAHFPIASEREEYLQLFDPPLLIEGYLSGRASVSHTAYSVRRDNRSCFVRTSASVTRHPISGELIAFITEEECNSDKVRETLMDKILAQHFDMVCYLVNGQYGVTIGQNVRGRKGNIFPVSLHGEYRDYLEHQVLPALVGNEEEKEQMSSALSLETVERRLAVEEPYVVDISVEVEGEIYYKQFDFFSIDPEARFYILLKSDTTEIQQSHLEMNEQLRLALDAANQANVAKTAFLSSMSHEIRTPMNAIIGLDHIALMEPGLSERTRGHLEKIGASARHLLGLINDILDMTRIESGRMDIRREEFSLREMLMQVNTMAEGQCREKGLSYQCTVREEAFGCFIGDALKIRQVLLNILGNAVKFTPVPGQVNLTVGKTGSYGNQATFCFTIRDTGIGMDAAYIPKIFEAFSQEDSSARNKYGSTGLGMAITKNIVDMMNGSIRVESVKGEGSAFFVTIPLLFVREEEAGHFGGESRPGEKAAKPGSGVPSAASPAEIPQSEISGGGDGADAGSGERPDAGFGEDAEPGQFAPEILGGRRVLLAEDILINAEIMEELLNMEGIEVEHAENGRIAVDLFTENPPGYYDAILMDLRMPVLDGLSAAREIRESGRPDAADIPIIALTANAFEEDVQRSLQAGMDAHLSKPVESTRLYGTLAEMIGRRKRNVPFG